MLFVSILSDLYTVSYKTYIDVAYKVYIYNELAH